ncbi:MAG: hypothetical protein ACAH21_08915 [Ramlibacter sp.]|nr:hypothetical protein [Ramlibacter sp.]
MNNASHSLVRVVGATAVLLFAGTVSTAKVSEARSAATAVAALAAAVGVVQAIRRVEHGEGEAASFEFTVRLRDGTTRTSHSASADKWRSGDRIMLIGGAATTAATH